jgi:hypothetical protein
MFSNTAFDTVRTSEDIGLCNIAVRKLENDFVGTFLNGRQALVKPDVLEWDEAGHDFQQVPSMCLSDVC